MSGESGGQIASRASAICSAHGTSFGTSFADCPVVRRVIRGAHQRAPAPSRRTETSFPFKKLDEYLLSLPDLHLQDEVMLRDGAIITLHRQTYGRLGELRGLSMERFLLRDAKNMVLAHSPRKIRTATTGTLVLRGTKHGTGPHKEATIMLRFPRARVIGQQRWERLSPLAYIAQLQGRYTGRGHYTKDNDKARKEQKLYGNGFFLDAKPNADGQYAFLASGSFGSSVLRVLSNAGLSTIPGLGSIRGYDQRGNAESLLVDSQFNVAAVCKHARHQEKQLKRTYYNESDQEHTSNVFHLRERFSDLRQSEALCCATMRMAPSKTANQAHMKHRESFTLKSK
jgi:hypothetical protein